MAGLFAHIGDQNERKLFRAQDLVPILLLLDFYILSKNKLVNQNILHFVLFAVFIPPLLVSFWWRLRDIQLHRGWMITILIPPFLLGLSLWRNWSYLTFFSALAVCVLMILMGRLGPRKSISTANNVDSGDPQS
jgi:hypothetical protein